ncbi:MAG TPA: penicillin acylase family protein, partial [Pyrinomonadaceae bacterium]|nr:penicillin acylase family protein [Pyrinomonadaceae bacterium]
RVLAADKHLTSLLDSLKKGMASNPGSSAHLRSAYDELSKWDHRATTAAVGTTLFVLWTDQLEKSKSKDDKSITAALAEVLKQLETDFGTWRIGWGEINRLQRPDESKAESFQDNRPSVPVPGVGGRDGAVFTFYADQEKGQKRRYGVAGGTYVSIVEFAPTVKGKSVHVFGASGDPKSRHFMDQSELYARGQFKPAWLELADIKANLESSYQPGKERSRKN